MLDDVDKRFELIKQEFIQNNMPIELTVKAYEFAKSLHKNQRRKDGRPYISHPVEVALILARLGFYEDVVIAALLHDVVEDCGCTLETIEKEFNKNIAELVDCVSSIDEAKFVFDKDDIYENTDFEKASMEEQSFKKLIAIGKKNPLGFCIKFADRLHNLRTIDTFAYSKQLEKVKETERWIIPIAKVLKTEYFYRSIKNECFKIVHKYDGVEYFAQYDNYHIVNKENLELLNLKLQEIFSNSNIRTIKIKEVREYKVFEDLSELLKTLNISKVSQGQILKVTNYNIYLLYDKGDYKEVIADVFNMLNKRIGDELKIIDAKVGHFTNKPYFQLEDKYKNKYNLYVMSLTDYTIQRNGTLNGRYNYILDENDLDTLEEDLIKVKTMDGEIIYIPKGSTALDFAFKIHCDIGFGFKYALINGSKTKLPPYTKVYEGDQIEIVVEKDENNEILNNAELRWLAYVNTETAKRNLIKMFERRIIK